MRLRIISFIVLFLFSLLAFSFFSFTNRNVGKISYKSEVPGSTQIADVKFGQFTNSVKIAEWDRENTFYNYNLFLKQGLGPDISSLDERNLDVNPKGIRVLVIGDSFVWGDGVTDAGMTIGTRIQDELNSLVGSDIFTVINNGKSGASTYNHAEYFTKERLELIKPDLIVYAYYVNDTVPNFNEKMICVDKTVCNQFSPQSAPEYRDCIDGKSNVFNKVVTNVVRSRFPSFANDLIIRNCDSIYKRLSIASHTDEQLWSDNKSNPWFPTWKKAVATFATNTKDIPTFMAHLYFNKPEVKNDLEITKEFTDVGIPVIPMQSALDKIYEVGSGSLALNPVNAHSNSILTKLYAKDIANYLIKNIDPNLLSNSKAKGYSSNRKLVSSVLPISVDVTENTSKSAKVSIKNFNKNDDFPHVIAGKPLPSQFVACVDLSYSHIQVNLNRFISPGSTLTISPQSSNAGKFTLGYYHYNKDYTPVFQEVGLLSSNITIKVPEESHGILLTVGMKDKNKNCPLTDVITIENLSIGIQLG